MTTEDAMKSATLAQIKSYQSIIEVCRHQANRDDAQLHGRHMAFEERDIRSRAIWAKFTLSTAELELAILSLTTHLVEAESLKPIRVVAP